MRKLYIFILLIAGLCLFAALKPQLTNVVSHGSSAKDIPAESKSHFAIPSILKNSTFVPQKKEPLMILVLGSDQRSEESARSDSIILTQYNPKDHHLKVISIMRDAYVNIPGHGFSKINHAYSWGGKELMKKTIEQNFGVKIDHIALINFNGFTKLVDDLIPDGISVNVTEEMVNYFHWNLKTGNQKLHGSELLQYVRFRHDIGNDFGRVARQQEVVGKIKDEVMNKIQNGEGVSTVLSIIRSGMNMVDTDLAFSEALEYGMNVMVNPINDVSSLRIPIENSFWDEMTDHSGLVLQFNESKNTAAIQEFLSDGQIK